MLLATCRRARLAAVTQILRAEPRLEADEVHKIVSHARAWTWPLGYRLAATNHNASYSTRSALSGAALAACRAGMTHASMAIAVSNSTTMIIVKGSMAVTP